MPLDTQTKEDLERAKNRIADIQQGVTDLQTPAAVVRDFTPFTPTPITPGEIPPPQPIAGLSAGQAQARAALDNPQPQPSMLDSIGNTVSRTLSGFFEGFGAQANNKIASTRILNAQANFQQAKMKEQMFEFGMKQRARQAEDHAPKTLRKLASKQWQGAVKGYMKDNNLKDTELSPGDLAAITQRYNVMVPQHLQFGPSDDDATLFSDRVQGELLSQNFMPHDVLLDGLKQEQKALMNEQAKQKQFLSAQTLLSQRELLVARAAQRGISPEALAAQLEGPQGNLVARQSGKLNQAINEARGESVAKLPAQMALEQTKAQAKGQADILVEQEKAKQDQLQLDASIQKADKDRTSREKVASERNLSTIEGIKVRQDLVTAREKGLMTERGKQGLAQLQARHQAVLVEDQANIGAKIVLQTLKDFSEGERLTEKLAKDKLTDLQKGAGDATARAVMKELHESGQVDLTKIAQGLKAGEPLGSILFDAITDVHEDVSVENEIKRVLSDPGAKGSTETALLGIKPRFNLEEGSPGAQRVDEAVRSIQTPLTDNQVLTGMQKVIRQAATHAKVGTFDPITGQINSLTLFENNPKDTNKYIQSLEDSLTTFPELTRGIRPLVKRLKAIRDREETGKTTHKGFTTALPNHGDLTKIQFSRPGDILGGLSPNDITLGQMLDELKEDGEYTDPKGRQQKIFKRDTKEEKVRYFRNDDGDVQANVTKDGETRAFTLEQFKDSIEWIPIKE